MAIASSPLADNFNSQYCGLNPTKQPATGHRMLSERELVSPLIFANSQSQVYCRVLTFLCGRNDDLPSIDLL